MSNIFVILLLCLNILHKNFINLMHLFFFFLEGLHLRIHFLQRWPKSSLKKKEITHSLVVWDSILVHFKKYYSHRLSTKNPFVHQAIGETLKPSLGVTQILYPDFFYQISPNLNKKVIKFNLKKNICIYNIFILYNISFFKFTKIVKYII